MYLQINTQNQPFEDKVAKFCEIYSNTYFKEHLRVNASEK